MQVQSAADPPKKLAQGERAVMADGGEYVVTELKAKGDPVEAGLRQRGHAIGHRTVGRDGRAPNPNAARCSMLGR